MKIDGFQKMLTLTRKTRVKVIIFVKTRNDPRVITVISPQAVSHKPIIKMQFLTKVLKSIFSEVWGSVLGQYSTI